MEQVDQEYLNDFLKSNSSGNETKTRGHLEKPSVTYEEIFEMAKKMGRGNRELDMSTIVHFIQVSTKRNAYFFKIFLPLLELFLILGIP